jgi:hypothetical protein
VDGIFRTDKAHSADFRQFKSEICQSFRAAPDGHLRAQTVAQTVHDLFLWVTERGVISGNRTTGL